MNRTSLAYLLCALVVPLATLAGTPNGSAPAITEAPSWHYPNRPIASREQLEAYLHDTPANASPLSLLNPAARRRFLAGLVFSARGLAGFSTDDLKYDLTRVQAWQVLRLFGEESYATGLPARTRPRPAGDVRATLEQAYDRLVAMQDQNPAASALPDIYAESFAPAQARLAWLGDRDTELLFRATDRLVSTMPDRLGDLRRDFAELERRGLADRPHADAYYNALLFAHRTDQARALLAAYPSLGRSPPPTLRTAPNLRVSPASVWIASGDRELWRLPLMLHDRAQVVVLGSPHCHFSENAARDIGADVQLRQLFRDHAQWVAPARDIVDFEALKAWNRAHRAQKLAIAYADDELPFVRSLDTPVFYFLRNGKLAATLIGWPGPTQREALRQRLKQIGLLH